MNFFPRPVRPNAGPPPPRPVGRAPAPAAPEAGHSLAAHPNGTIFALVAIAFAALTLNGVTPVENARYAAICVGIGLAGSIAFDLRRGLFNLQRADLFAILAYYFLTLFEFLFPQPNFDRMLTRDSAREGTIICLIGFAGLFIGRHLFIPKKQPFQATLTHEIPRGWLLVIFWLSFIIGYSNMLITVRFNFVDLVNWFMAPRFTQPWGRDRLGDWSALLYELNMLIQLIPPLAGIILARRHRYPTGQLILIVAVLALTFFYGFAGGTRNVFATFLVTFMMGYALAIPRDRSRELLILAPIAAVLMCAATFYMLQFREAGLKNYLQGKWTPPPQELGVKKTLYVDYNLFSICKLADFFPRTHEYLGFEIPYQALIRPIPRAVWPGKPTGLSMSIEDAMNMEGLTISASFAGEAYMSGGSFAVFGLALLLGGFMGWWGALYSPSNSEIGHLVYASGFFAAVISMRSLFVFTTALLPTVAAIVISTLVVRTLIKHAGKILHRPPPIRHAPPRRPMPPQPMRRV